jgi:prephenate dehydrogenase
MTRVATLNVPMWAELFIENRDYLAEEVEALSARLDSYAKALRRGDTAEVARLLDLGCMAKRRMEEKEAAIHANGSHPGIQAL